MSAKQGKALKALVDAKTSNTGTITGIKMNGTTYSKAVNTTWTNVLYHNNKTINCILSFRFNSIIANTDHCIILPYNYFIYVITFDN